MKGKRDEKPQDLGNGPAGVNNRNDPSKGFAIEIEQPVVFACWILGRGRASSPDWGHSAIG